MLECLHEKRNLFGYFHENENCGVEKCWVEECPCGMFITECWEDWQEAEYRDKKSVMTEEEKREKLKLRLKTAWQITKAVLFPLFVVIAVVSFIIGGALFAIVGESFKKIYK